MQVIKANRNVWYECSNCRNKYKFNAEPIWNHFDKKKECHDAKVIEIHKNGHTIRKNYIESGKILETSPLNLWNFIENDI